jgi:hypothetical protein
MPSKHSAIRKITHGPRNTVSEVGYDLGPIGTKEGKSRLVLKLGSVLSPQHGITNPLNQTTSATM